MQEEGEDRWHVSWREERESLLFVAPIKVEQVASLAKVKLQHRLSFIY